MSKQHTLTLQNPVTRDGKPVHDIALREPSAGELRGIKLFDLVQGDAGAIAELLPRISTPTLTKAEALSLKMRDLTAAMNIIGLMLTDEETMGKDSQPL